MTNESVALDPKDQAEPCYVSSLMLSNFRNYGLLEMNMSEQSVILVGANGAGKTNILEAVSLLTPGRGLRSAKLDELRHAAHRENGWAVAAEVMAGGEEHQLGTGVITGEKRSIRIDGEDKKNQHALGLYCSAVWLTPQMCHMFGEGRGVRRRFFDRLVYNFDMDHASRIYSYEHTSRERLKLLTMRKPDSAWLKVLEEKLAAQSVAIAVARLQLLEQLNYACAELKDGAFPVAEVRLAGDAEALLASGLQAVDAEASLTQQLMENRGEDARRGRSTIGAHRTEMQVYFVEKGVEAALCSTGEQKALLLSVLMAHVKARAYWQGRMPLLLLDEVVAHLDVNRRAALFEMLKDMQIQCWMTGTDAADFSGFAADAQLFNVNNSTAIRI